MDIQKFINNKKPRLLVISGAGLSVESGLSAFRYGEDALWENVKINDVCNISNFVHKYHKVHSFYNTLRVSLNEKEPNEAHKFIAEWEALLGNDTFLHITANIDDLYEKVGGTCMHLHGYLTEVIENYSLSNNDYTVKDIGYTAYIPTPGIHCKPNVVMLGEYERYVDGQRIPLYNERNEVMASLRDEDTVIIIGSSDEILRWSEMVGLGTPAYTINVNPSKNERDWMFDTKIYKKCTNALPELDEIIKNRMK